MERTRVPTMVSFRRLHRRKMLPRALAPWVQDSGGFNELALHGRYQISPREYAHRTRIHAQQVGRLAYAAVQDWMCEDMVLQKTGLTIEQHQRRTVESYWRLRQLAPELPWLPVLQGQVIDDYERHADMYLQSGLDLWDEPLVGLGTVCRRQHTRVAQALIDQIASWGLRIHGFGLKVTALQRCSTSLKSADSMAWSFDGRMPKGGRCLTPHGHANCANCLDWALLWRRKVLDGIWQGVVTRLARAVAASAPSAA